MKNLKNVTKVQLLWADDSNIEAAFSDLEDDYFFMYKFELTDAIKEAFSKLDSELKHKFLELNYTSI